SSKDINRQYIGIAPDTVGKRFSGGCWAYIFSSIEIFCRKLRAPGFPGLAIWVCAIFSVSSLAYTVNDVSPSDFTFIMCLVVLVALAIFYIWRFDRNFRSIKYWAEKEGPNILGLNALWQEYCSYGRFEHRAG